MQIVKAPEVLSLHLKRFTPTGRKITSTIKYTGNLNLQPYMDAETGSPTYELYAVTVHQGSGPHLGHYFSYVKNKNGKWFEANDESVSVSQARIFPAAYILHYIRKPGSALDAIKAGKVNGINTPRKSLSDTHREELQTDQGTPVAGPSSPSKRGEKRKQMEEAEQPEQSTRSQPTLPGKSDGETSSDDNDDEEAEPEHVQKKSKSDTQPSGRKFAPVSSQVFGYGTSSVSEALKSKRGSDRTFEARPAPQNGQNKGNKRRNKGKSNSSPYTAGGPTKLSKMQGRDFRRT
jgi:ubiquitin carboxyl-terminal hydrolase 36/42